jgi:hypothetical protein
MLKDVLTSQNEIPNCMFAYYESLGSNSLSFWKYFQLKNGEKIKINWTQIEKRFGCETMWTMQIVKIVNAQYTVLQRNVVHTEEIM